MLVLEPISIGKIWGTNRLHEYCGDKSIESIGLVYSASGISTISNPIKSKKFNELDFCQAVKNNPELFGLPDDYEEFPIIVSFTAADADLSIQVHPTDEYAQEYEGKKYGKSESWYFIEKPKEGWIYTESKENDKALINKKMNQGKFEDVIGKTKVAKNDLIFIPSGTLHALTAGSLVYEIQQSTDITYRFFDFNRIDKDGRKRKLHTKKAINTLETKNKVSSTKVVKNKIIEEEPYSLYLTHFKNNYHNSSNIAEIVTVIEGEYNINDEKIVQGMSLVVFPNEHLNVKIINEGKVMIATPIIQ